MRIVFIAIIVGLLAYCSASNRKSPASIQVSSSPAQTDDGLPPMSYEQMIPELARLSKQAGVANLRALGLTDSQTELRLWKAFGLVYPRYFVLRIENDNASASFVSPKVIADKAVVNKGNPVYVNTPLKAPRSGWSNLLTYLRQNGIDSSINLTLDKRCHPYPDAEALILEMKTGSRHTMAHYIDSTVSDDGKKAFAICEKIQHEFDIQLACKS
jgi:hypothetical protein